MALVKKSKIAVSSSKSTTPPPAGKPSLPAPPATARPSRPAAHPDTIAVRIAAATEELASGLAEAAAATKELGRSMERLDESVDLLSKPYSSEALARKLRHLLTNAAQRKLLSDRT